MKRVKIGLSLVTVLGVLIIGSASSIADTGTYSVDQLKAIGSTYNAGMKDLLCSPRTPETSATTAQQQKIIDLAKSLGTLEQNYTANINQINSTLDQYYTAISQFDTCVKE